MMDEARNDIRKHFKVGELLDWDKRYHRNIARYEDRLDLNSIEQDWPGMLGTVDLDNGCIARELTSSKALKIQGRAEDHCVGGYVSTILNSQNHSRGRATMIFSIEQNDRILSTAKINCFMEFPESGNPGQLCTQVCQNKARNNTSPNPMAEALTEQVAVRLQQAGPEAFQTYLDGLHDSRVKQEQISGFECLIVQCGLDPRDRTHLETVWEELGLALPRRFREGGLDAFIRHGLRKPPKGISQEVQFDNQDLINVEGQHDVQQEEMPEHNGA